MTKRLPSKSLIPGLTIEKNEEKVVRSGHWNNSHHLHEPTPEEVLEYISRADLEIVGQLGQMIVSPKTAERARKLNKTIPIWPLFVYWPGRNPLVVKVPDGKTCLTKMFVARKPASEESS